MGSFKKKMQNNKSKRGGKRGGNTNTNSTLEPRKSVENFKVETKTNSNNSNNNSINPGSARSSGKKFNPKELNLPNLDGSFDKVTDFDTKKSFDNEKEDQEKIEKLDY